LTDLNIKNLQGPILVLGASGFLGSNLFRRLLQERSDVFGTSSHLPAWRLADLPKEKLIGVDILVESNLTSLLDTVKPQTIFDFIAYGAYSFQSDTELIYKTNILYLSKLTQEVQSRGIHRFLHAGSSSEYGENAAGPSENDMLTPNSHYSVSKMSASGLLYFLGKHKKFPCANLRIYSAYGPYEDSSRLIPQIVTKGLLGEYPPLVDPNISRDFIFVDDVSEAFIKAALNLEEKDYGLSFNIGTGIKTTISKVAELSKEIFSLKNEPLFKMPARQWDVADWYANIQNAQTSLKWQPHVSFKEGLSKTITWYKSLPNKQEYEKSSKQYGLDTKHSISAIVTIYKDEQAIPIMYERLTEVFIKLRVEYQIIFVNDNSPDNSEAVIREISSRDRRVLGINHSRNFGSQAAFKSGMEFSTKNSCVLLDGDLQDPPELIEAFVAKWREGYDVVYGRRVKRQAPFYMQIAYKAFYRVFDLLSYVVIPHDAGDFALMDRKIVQALLQFPERDLFIRGIRAFAGFRQIGVDYTRPERMFGKSTNNFLKNVSWAKKGILSFSNTPLNILSLISLFLFLLSFGVGILQIILKLMYPELSPKGITTTLLVIMFFGSCNLLAIGLIGEYVAKIFEEVKRRPLFVRRSLIKDGEVSDTLLNASKN
jgi:polyisoprenyl-phosphate glycosyltransferase